MSLRGVMSLDLRLIYTGKVKRNVAGNINYSGMSSCTCLGSLDILEIILFIAVPHEELRLVLLLLLLLVFSPLTVVNCDQSVTKILPPTLPNLDTLLRLIVCHS